MSIEQKLLALMEGTKVQVQEAVQDKYIVGHHKDGAGMVVVAGPYGHADDTAADEKSFHDHPDYVKIEVRPHSDCIGCRSYTGKIHGLSEKKEETPDEEAKDQTDAENAKADQIEDEPVVKIDNPIDPDLDPSGEAQEPEATGSDETEDKKKMQETKKEAWKKLAEEFKSIEGIKEEFKPFSKMDWYGWGGAEPFKNGDQPKIMQHGPWTVIAAGDQEVNQHHSNDHATIHAYHDDMVNEPEDGKVGIHGQHNDDIIKIYEGPRRAAEALMSQPQLVKASLDAIHKAHYGDSRPYESNHLELIEPKHFDKLSEKKIEEFLKDEELSEEFQLKASTLFQAKLTEAVEAQTVSLQEDFNKKLEEAIASNEKDTFEKIDGYFEALSEKWMQENEVAIDAAIRSELTESFIEGVISLAQTHSIELPIEKKDGMKMLEEQLESLKGQLAGANSLIESQRDALNDATREIVLEEMTGGMTKLESSKFKSIMEDFEFETKDKFVARCEVIKESFFGKVESQKLQMSTQALTEEKKPEVTKKPVSEVSQFASFIKQSVAQG